jgi:HK97 family phage major capsid protein
MTPTIDKPSNTADQLSIELRRLADKRNPFTADDHQRARVLIDQADHFEARKNIQNAGMDELEISYNRAFESFLRHGLEASAYDRGVTAAERRVLESRDMGVGLLGGAYPGATSGFVASLSFNTEVTSALKHYGGVISTATLVDTPTGAPRAFPSDNDAQVTGEMLLEGAPASQVDVPIGQKILSSFRFSSRIVKVSLEQVRDAGFDLPGYLAQRLGIRLVRVFNDKFTSGSEPMGLINAADVGAVAVGSESNTGNADGPATVGSDDVCALVASVDAAYRTDGGFMMHANVLAGLQRLKDRVGLPVFPGLHSGGANSILNFPVFVNNAMSELPTAPSSPAVTYPTIAFGAFSRYTIRRAPMMVYRLSERFAELGQVAFLILQRADGNLMDGGGGAVKTLVNIF